jgi:hypothetical protein
MQAARCVAVIYELWAHIEEGGLSRLKLEASCRADFTDYPKKLARRIMEKDSRVKAVDIEWVLDGKRRKLTIENNQLELTEEDT